MPVIFYGTANFFVYCHEMWFTETHLLYQAGWSIIFKINNSSFYILLTVHLGTIRVNNQLDALFFNVSISLLYMFRATQRSSSGESIVSIHHLVYITLCRWPSGMQVRDLHTGRTPTQSDIYQMMYWYNWLSWWWALGCSKHVEKWNRHTKKKCVKFVINTNYKILR